MPTGTETSIATLVAVLITASLPFYLYGAWVILTVNVVTWRVLVRHLKFILTGLILTTLPIIGWMMPRFLEQLDGFLALHAFLGLQAYALLVFALTGIVRIFQAKHTHDLYRNPDQDIAIDDLHEDMSAWRFRLRVGVFGFLLFWLLSWLVGMARFGIVYL